MNTTNQDQDLEELRAELDRIDRAIHDLVMERATVVERVGAAKGDGSAIRPGREASILRALVGRHRGPFPKRAVVRIWREIMAASVWLQGPFSIAVYEPNGEVGYWDLARAQYGIVARHHAYRSASEVVGAVTGGSAHAGILPMPGSVVEREPWWVHLLGSGPTTPRVIGRLPFTGVGTLRSGGLEAMTIARTDPEETGDDRSWLVVESEEEVSRAMLGRTLSTAGLEGQVLEIWSDAGLWLVLVEAAGYVAADDERMERLRARSGGGFKDVHRIGVYPVPLDSSIFADEREDA